MKFALIVPKGVFRSQRENILSGIFREVERSMPIFKREDVELMPNLGLVTIGSLIPPPHEAIYLDEEFMTPDEVRTEILEARYDAVLLTAMDNQANRAYALADLHRAYGARVVIGGYHASALPEEALRHADAVLTGEAEETFPALLADLLAGRDIRGIRRPARPVDLSACPPVDPRLFARFLPGYNKLPLLITRGCPNDCDFCSVTKLYGRTHRHKTVAQVIADARALKALSRHRLISVADENAFVNRAFMRELLPALAAERIRYEAYTDLSIADDPGFLELIRASGCIELLVGFESVVRENLETGARWKAARFDRYRDAIDRIQGAGLPIMGLFMLGFDHDRPDVFARVRDFILETNLYEVDFAVQTPLPGTDLFRRYEAEGRLLSRDWDLYTWERVVHRPANMTPEELEAGIRWLYGEFNTPERIARRRRHFKEILARPAPEPAPPSPAAP